jgi:hypothetical protein
MIGDWLPGRRPPHALVRIRINVILSEAKNPSSILNRCRNGNKSEMFRFAQFATGRIRRGGHDSTIEVDQ